MRTLQIACTDAQLVTAREHGFDTWPKFRKHIDILAKFGVESHRMRDEFVWFWISAILNFGAVKTDHVAGEKK